MPCDSIILNQVHLGLANKELLAAALKDMGATNIRARGHSFSFDLDGRPYLVTDELSGEGTEAQIGAIADRIKQAYSGQAVKRAASRFGWQVKKTATNKFAITRRS